MSVLSDDTDVLLLIPPDFFLVPSDSDEEVSISKKASESLLVSDLIFQVNELEGRVCQIESQCADDCIMTATGNLRQLRQYGSADTLNVAHKTYMNSRSLQATPLKNCTALSPSLSWRTSENSSCLSIDKKTNYPLEHRQNILTSNDYVLQKEKDAQILKEIDQFFKQKKGKHDDPIENEKHNNFLYDRGKTNVSLIPPEGTVLSSAAFSLKKVNELLSKLDETQKEIEQKLKLKDLEEIDADDILVYESSQNLAEKDTKSPPELDNSKNLRNPKRALKFDDPSPKDTKDAKCYPPISNAEFHCGAEESSNSCINNKAKPLTVAVEEKADLEKKIDARPSKEISNLLSLSNLWGSSGNMYKTTSYEDQQLLKQRLQEERCRRQHCEELIQQLQLRLLEEQQKIAVAVKVDQEKDKAISQLTEGWNKVVGHWRDLESQRNSLAKKLLTDRDKFKQEMNSACQTVKRFEVELSKALDLAHGYKEKCEAADKEKKAFKGNLVKEMEVLKTELRTTMEKLEAEEEKNSRLEKQHSAKEESLNQTKVKVTELQNQNRELKKQLKECQVELETVKHDKDKAVEKLKEEKNRSSSLEQNKKTLLHHNEELKKKEKSLKDETKNLTDQVEKTKLELKEFYQNQVENIVQEKLKEFQSQLASAEKMLQKEIEVRERAVTELAVQQVQQIVEKHVVEINILEEKHKAEIELWQIQVAKCEEKVSALQRKLEHHTSHKNEIAAKLHSVMETQWQEALKIITAGSPQQPGKSPLNSGRSEKGVTLGRQNTFTMTTSGWGEGQTNKSESSSPTTTTDTPFCKDGQLTCREQVDGGALTYRIDETPQKIASMSQDHLKKCIQVLLGRAPGRPTDESVDKSLDSTSYHNLDGRISPHWQQILSDASSQPAEPAKQSDPSKSAKENKRPWK